MIGRGAAWLPWGASTVCLWNLGYQSSSSKLCVSHCKCLSSVPWMVSPPCWLAQRWSKKSLTHLRFRVAWVMFVSFFLTHPSAASLASPLIGLSDTTPRRLGFSLHHQVALLSLSLKEEACRCLEVFGHSIEPWPSLETVLICVIKVMSLSQAPLLWLISLWESGSLEADTLERRLLQHYHKVKDDEGLTDSLITRS